MMLETWIVLLNVNSNFNNLNQSHHSKNIIEPQDIFL